MFVDFLTLVLMIGATIRISRLIMWDSILDRPRDWVMDRLSGGKDPHWIRMLLQRCPYCLPVWIAGAVSVWAYFGHDAWWFVWPAAGLSAAYAASVLLSREV